MTPEEKSLLERTYKMTEENHTILRKMRRSSIIGSIFHFLYWIFIIGVSIGAFYYLQPYIKTMTDIIHQAQDTIQKINSTTERAQNTLSSFGK